MELVRLFIFISTVIFIGMNILYLISFKRGGLYFLERLALSYGIGLGFITIEMLLFYLFKFKYDLAKILAPWIILVVINVILYLRNKKGLATSRQIAPGDHSHKTLQIFLIAGITFEILYALFRALIKPMESYDAIAIYAIKAKIFYLAGSIPKDFFSGLILLFPHPDYPLNIPLSETLGYLFMGSLNDQLVKIIFPLYFIGILAIMYCAIRRYARPTYALLFTFILATIPQFNAYATNGYLDLVLSYYYFTSALFLLYWFANKDQLHLLCISAVMASLGGWTKNEGLMYCVINTVLMPIYFIIENKKITKKDGAHILIYVAILLMISLPWLWVKYSCHISNSDVVQLGSSSLNLIKGTYNKIWPIIYEFQKQILGPKKWNILWLALIYIMIINRKKAFGNMQKYLAISLFLAVSGYIFFYLTSPIEINFFLAKTWNRFLIHFLPVVVYWLANTLREDIKP